MIQSQILQPIVVLLAWTMIMWLWMYATRIPAMSKAGIDPNDARRTKALDETLPAEVQWKAHNYNHLHEAPTVFYAVALVLAMTGVHHMFGRWRKTFAADKNTRSARFYRIWNEVPTVLMIGIVFLVVLKPF